MSDTAKKLIVVAHLVVVLSSCASTGDLVKCDGHLEPINAPGLRAKQAVVPADGGESDATRVGHE